MKFDKKFVHCVWDGSLVGKLCVFADDIPNLRNNGQTRKEVSNGQST